MNIGCEIVMYKYQLTPCVAESVIFQASSWLQTKSNATKIGRIVCV